jgi:SAM-dependent methyltransferase
MRARLGAALERGTAGHYTDAVFYDHEYARRRHDVAFYLKVAKAHARGPILELGCGSGRLAIPLARAGHEVVGVDASSAMLRACRARADRLGLEARVHLHRADFRALGAVLGRQRFHLIFCPFNAFQHLYDLDEIEGFLAGVRSHLAADGWFVFDIMNPDLKWLSRDPNHRWDRTRYKDPHTGAAMTYATQLVYDAPLQIAFMTVWHERVDNRGVRRRPRQQHLAHRHFFPRELEALLHYNGLPIVRREGDFDGGPLETESEQQVLWCRARPQNSRRKRVDL